MLFLYGYKNYLWWKIKNRCSRKPCVTGMRASDCKIMSQEHTQLIHTCHSIMNRMRMSIIFSCMSFKVFWAWICGKALYKCSPYSIIMICIQKCSCYHVYVFKTRHLLKMSFDSFTVLPFDISPHLFVMLLLVCGVTELVKVLQPYLTTTDRKTWQQCECFLCEK